ncbi:MAG: hypothetical protein ACK4OM_06875 [Alphaproteobacteria bacterium]
MPFAIACRDPDSAISGLFVNTRQKEEKNPVAYAKYNRESKFQYIKTSLALQEDPQRVVDLANAYIKTPEAAEKKYENLPTKFTDAQQVADYIKGLKGQKASDFTRESKLQQFNPNGWHKRTGQEALKIEIMRKVQSEFIELNPDRKESKDYIVTLIALKQLDLNIIESSRKDDGWGIKTENNPIEQGGTGQNNLGKIHNEFADEFVVKLGSNSSFKFGDITINKTDIEEKKKQIQKEIASGELKILEYSETKTSNVVTAKSGIDKYASTHGIQAPNPNISPKKNISNPYVNKGGYAIDTVLNKLKKEGVKGLKIEEKDNNPPVLKLIFNSPQEAHSFGRGKVIGPNQNAVVMDMNTAQAMFKGLGIEKTKVRDDTWTMAASLIYDYDRAINSPAASTVPQKQVQQKQVQQSNFSASSNGKLKYASIENVLAEVKKMVGTDQATLRVYTSTNGEEVIDFKFKNKDVAQRFLKDKGGNIARENNSVAIPLNDVGEIFDKLNSDGNLANKLKAEFNESIKDQKIVGQEPENLQNKKEAQTDKTKSQQKPDGQREQRNRDAAKQKESKSTRRGATLGVACGIGAIIILSWAFPPLGAIVTTTAVAAGILCGCAAVGAIAGKMISKSNNDKNEQKRSQHNDPQSPRDKNPKLSNHKQPENPSQGMSVPAPHTPPNKVEKTGKRI